MTRWLILTGALAALATGGAAAQDKRLRFAGSLSGAGLNVRSALSTGAEALGGGAFGGEGRATWQILSVNVAYREGKLDPDTAGPAARDYVEGYFFLGARPVDWLELRAGPHARAYTTPSGVQRWWFWELRARFEAPLMAQIRGYAEGWTALAADVSVGETFDGAFGGAAGLVARVGRSPFSIRAQYAIDETRMGDGARRETVEGLTLAVGVGAW